MAETPEAQEAVMKAWMDWFGTLGAVVVDGDAAAKLAAGCPVLAAGGTVEVYEALAM